MKIRTLNNSDDDEIDWSNKPDSNQTWSIEKKDNHLKKSFGLIN